MHSMKVRNVLWQYIKVYLSGLQIATRIATNLHSPVKYARYIPMNTCTLDPYATAYILDESPWIYSKSQTWHCAVVQTTPQSITAGGVSIFVHSGSSCIDTLRLVAGNQTCEHGNLISRWLFFFFFAGLSATHMNHMQGMIPWKWDAHNWTLCNCSVETEGQEAVCVGLLISFLHPIASVTVLRLLVVNHNWSAASFLTFLSRLKVLGKAKISMFAKM